MPIPVLIFAKNAHKNKIVSTKAPLSAIIYADAAPVKPVIYRRWYIIKSVVTTKAKPMVTKSVSMNFLKTHAYNQIRQLPWPVNTPVSKKMMKILYVTKHPVIAE